MFEIPGFSFCKKTPWPLGVVLDDFGILSGIPSIGSVEPIEKETQKAQPTDQTDVPGPNRCKIYMSVDAPSTEQVG
jgi:hypothetical protein